MVCWQAFGPRICELTTVGSAERFPAQVRAPLCRAYLEAHLRRLRRLRVQQNSSKH